MFNYNFRKDAVEQYQDNVRQFNALIKQFNIVCQKNKTAIKEAISTIYGVEELVGGIGGVPIELVRDIKKIIATHIPHNAYDFNEQAKDEMFTTGGIFVAGCTLTVACTQVAKHVLTKGAPKFIGKVALKSLAGPVGWGLMGAEAVWSGYSISDKNREIGNKAIREARKLCAQSGTLEIQIADAESQLEKLKTLSEKIKGLLEQCGQFRDTDFIKLDDDDKQRLYTLINTALALASLIKNGSTKEEAA